MIVDRLNILHVYRTYFPDPPGGTQEAIRQMCLSLQPFNVRATIFTLSPSPRPAKLELPEGPVVRCRSWMAPASCDIGGLSSLITYRRLARQADVVHMHYPWPFADVLNLSGRIGRPVILSYHSDIVRQGALERLYAPLRRLHFGSVDAIVATSPPYVRTSSLLARMPMRDKLAMLPLGMIDRSAEPVHGGPVAGESLDKPYFLFVGALRYYKGLQFLVSAAKATGFRVLIGGVGPELESLRQQVQRENVGSVRFLGMISDEDKYALMKNALAFVLPSHLRSEAFGVVLVEAAMMGKPMITCEIGTGTSWVNLNGETGIVVPPADAVALANAMRALHDDPSRRALLGSNARRRYLSNFSGESLGRGLHRLYTNVLEGRRPSEGLADGQPAQ